MAEIALAEPVAEDAAAAPEAVAEAVVGPFGPQFGKLRPPRLSPPSRTPLRCRSAGQVLCKFASAAAEAAAAAAAVDVGVVAAADGPAAVDGRCCC